MNSRYDTVILANGQFPTSPVPLDILAHATFVCACDGAIRHYPDANVVIGDGDSVPPQWRDRLIRVAEQEDNDLTKATRYLVSLGKKRIAYLGATGLREDHTLGNIALIVRYAREMGLQPAMFTDHGWFEARHGSATFHSCEGQQVSLFNVSCQLLESEGLRWQTYPYTQFWQGTLNEAIGTTFSVKADGWYLLYRTYL